MRNFRFSSLVLLLFISVVCFSQNLKNVNSQPTIRPLPITRVMGLDANGLVKLLVFGEMKDTIIKNLPTKQRVEEIATYVDLNEAARLQDVNNLQLQINSEASARNFGDLQRVLKSDTASMLAPYQKKVGFITSNNIAYVSRKWTGIRGGASWQAQLDAATVGSPLATYPDIWILREVMARLLVQGVLKNATIIIYEDEKFTAAEIGEGGIVDFNYPSTSINARYHPYPSTKGTGYDSLCLNLFFPNLTYDFKRGSGITHTSGKGRLGLPYDTLAPQIIKGEGIFNYKYNNWTGTTYVNVDWLSFLGKGYVEFSADSIRVSRVREDKFGWGVIGSLSSGIAKFRANYFTTFDNNGPFRGLSNFDCRIATLEVDTTQLPYNNDGSLSFSSWFLHAVTRGNNENVIINIDNAKLRGMGLFNINDYGIKNAKMYLSATNISQSYLPQYISSQVSADNSTGIIELFRYTANGAALNNSQIFCNIKNYKGQMSGVNLRSLSSIRVIKNSQINVQFDNYIQDSIPGAIQKVSFQENLLSDSSLVTVSGNFVNEKEAVLKLANNTKVDFRGVFKTQSTTKSAIELSGTNTNSKLSGALSVAGTQESISGTGTITVFPSATANTAPAMTITFPAGTVLMNNSAYKY